MKRAADWPARLYAYVESRRDVPFAWGDNDCCSFAAGAIEAMTGERLDVGFERETAGHAAAMLADVGGVAGIADLKLGARQSGRTARRGDIVLVEQSDDRDLLGVALGVGVAVPGRAGVLILPRSAAVHCWRVG